MNDVLPDRMQGMRMRITQLVRPENRNTFLAGLILTITALTAAPATGQTLYSFTNASSGVANTVASNMTATNLSRGSGLTSGDCGGGTDGYGADGWPTGGFNLNTANTNGDYIEFTITPFVNYEFNLTGFTANLRRDDPSGGSNDGPTDVRYAYSTDGGANFTDNGSDLTPNNSSSCSSTGTARSWGSFSLSSSNAVIFRIYGFNSGGSSGDLYLRNITITGTVIIPVQYRSRQNGNWNNTNTWESSTDAGGTWVNASNTPTSSNAGAVTVRNGDTVTVSNSVTVDQVTIEAGGQVNVNSGRTMTIADGSGADLLVQGTLQNTGTVSGSATLIFDDGSIYQHSQNGGAIPTATWAATSTCEITGMTGNDPTGDGQAFGNLTYDCSGMTSNRNMAGTGLSVAGNLQIANTGSFEIRQSQTSMTVDGDLILSGGTLRIGSMSARTMNVSGNLIVSGGTLRMTDGNQVGTLNLSGDFTQSAGLIYETGSGSGAFRFTGSGVQNLSRTGGTISDNINFTVLNTATLNLGNSDLTGSGGTFTLSGTLQTDIGSTNPVDFGQVSVGGAVSVSGGTVAPNFTFTPIVGNTFTLISGASHSGSPTLSITPGSITGSYLTGVLTVATVLPIELVFFQGKVAGRSVALTWQTRQEENNDYMAVERSLNGRDFEEIGRVAGSGTAYALKTYTLMDEHPGKGQNFYRLRQVDFDGKAVYHKVINVLFGQRDPGLGLALSPNPVAGQVTAVWQVNEETPTQLIVTDLAGREMTSFIAPQGVATLELPLESLPAGAYFLRIRQGAETAVLKFLKL